MNQSELEDALMAYLAKNDGDDPRFQALTTIQELLPAAKRHSEEHYVEDEDEDKYEDKEQIRVALDQLVTDGMVESHWGERDYEASYRISRDGLYQAVLGDDALVPVSDTADRTDRSSGFDPESFDSTSFETGDPRSSEVAAVSASWTGSELGYVEIKVIQELRVRAKELQTLAQRINYQCAGDERDLKGLADALVALSDMAEPDISLIVRILAHPKFKVYASLVAAAATIRGALGI